MELRDRERADGQMGRWADGRTATQAGSKKAKKPTAKKPTAHKPIHPPARFYTPVPLDSIAASMKQAALIGEDHHFWTHSGIDFEALRYALGYRKSSFSWTSARDWGELLPALRNAWARRAALRGASTISQQLAKNLYLSPSRNPFRKVKEAATAYRLELALGKQRILELYLNVAELGDEIWGVEAASWKYFDRPVRRVNRVQAAALAGALPFPLSSNPKYRPGRMRWRQNLILRRMGGEPIEVPQVAEATPVDSLPEAPDSSLWLDLFWGRDSTAETERE